MKYGIRPFGSVTEAYAWDNSSLEHAKVLARYLSEKYKIDVLVFEVIGTYSNKTVWELCDIEGKDNAD